jgi:hypothetical protein
MFVVEYRYDYYSFFSQQRCTTKHGIFIKLSLICTMFSINDDETQQVRQNERRVVEYVESILNDAAVQIMAMQVQCTAPDCVPVETVILILFPTKNKEEAGESSTDLSKESAQSNHGSSVQFKIFKPISEVTKDDVELSLPHSLYKYSLATTGRQMRNDLFTRIEGVFPTEDDISSRQWILHFLRESLQQYVDNGCQRPDHWREGESELLSEEEVASSTEASGVRTFPPGNITLRRPVDDEGDKVGWLQIRRIGPFYSHFTFYLNDIRSLLVLRQSYEAMEEHPFTPLFSNVDKQRLSGLCNPAEEAIL